MTIDSFREEISFCMKGFWQTGHFARFLKLFSIKENKIELDLTPFYLNSQITACMINCYSWNEIFYILFPWHETIEMLVNVSRTNEFPLACWVYPLQFYWKYTYSNLHRPKQNEMRLKTQIHSNTRFIWFALSNV